MRKLMSSVLLLLLFVIPGTIPRDSRPSWLQGQVSAQSSNFRETFRLGRGEVQSIDWLCRLLSSSGQDSPLKQPIDSHDANRPELECAGGETAVE
jgi:hypothetical protein